MLRFLGRKEEQGTLRTEHSGWVYLHSPRASLSRYKASPATCQDCPPEQDNITRPSLAFQRTDSKPELMAGTCWTGWTRVSKGLL